METLLVGPDNHSGDKFGTPYGSLTAFVFINGNVSWLSHSMSLTVYQALSTAGDGRVFPANKL